MRSSLFTVLERQIADARVLDAFAGTGVIGLEALSRGARHCTFVERDREALEVLVRNIRTVGFERRADVRAHDLRERLALDEPVDIAFLDPPFALLADGLGRRFLRTLLADLCARLVRPRGHIVFRYEEKHACEALDVLADVTTTQRETRLYGRSAVAILTLP